MVKALFPTPPEPRTTTLYSDMFVAEVVFVMLEV